ncbi:MAG TPA: hypothetical protein VN806_13660 [Caulobacteraceae bacterium]|nr:hypothetical protein [Caulobacteraceae bacterium]
MSPVPILLCRPLGGLNDVLCQIERCCAYADRFGRLVVVDTAEQSDEYFRDRFSNYFISLRPNLLLDTDLVRGQLDSLDVRPAFLAGRLRAARPRYVLERRMFIDEQSGQPISFDFECDHPETLIVHHQAGGGARSIGALARLSLRSELVEALRQRLAVLGHGYVGIHIRDTDYSTHYQAPLEQVAIDPGARIFVGTDSAAALAYCRAKYGADRVFSFAALRADGARLHRIEDAAQAYERNRDAILDLVTLALATQFHMFELQPNAIGMRFSGFSLLAATLRAQPAVLAQLTGVTELAELW